MQHIKKHKRILIATAIIAVAVFVLYLLKPHYAQSVLATEMQLYVFNAQNLFRTFFLQLQDDVQRLPKLIESLFSFTALWDALLKFVIGSVVISTLFVMVRRFDFSPVITAQNECPFVYNNSEIVQTQTAAAVSFIGAINTVRINS